MRRESLWNSVIFIPRQFEGMIFNEKCALKAYYKILKRCYKNSFALQIYPSCLNFAILK